MDATTLTWLLRVQEIETLLKARQTEYAHQLKNKEELQNVLDKNLAEETELCEQLLDLQQQITSAKLQGMRAVQQSDKLRAQLSDGSNLVRLRAQQRRAGERLQLLRDQIKSEQGRMERFSSLMSDHENEMSCNRVAMGEQLVQVEAKMPEFSAHYDVTPLDAKIQELQAGLSELSNQKAQLAAEMEGLQREILSIQDQVAEAERTEADKIQALQAELEAGRKELAHAVQQQGEADARMHNLRLSCRALHQRGCQLDQEIHRASATVHHLAGAYL